MFNILDIKESDEFRYDQELWFDELINKLGLKNNAALVLTQ